MQTLTAEVERLTKIDEEFKALKAENNQHVNLEQELSKLSEVNHELQQALIQKSN